MYSGSKSREGRLWCSEGPKTRIEGSRSAVSKAVKPAVWTSLSAGAATSAGRLMTEMEPSGSLR